MESLVNHRKINLGPWERCATRQAIFFPGVNEKFMSDRRRCRIITQLKKQMLFYGIKGVKTNTAQINTTTVMTKIVKNPTEKIIN